METGVDLAERGAEAPPEELFAANMRAFRERFPRIAERLDAIPERVATRRPSPDDNIVIDGTDLYPTRASEWVRLQLEGADKTARPISVDLSCANPSDIAMPIFDWAKGYVVERGLELRDRPVVDVGFHLVFGIGLGMHIRPLLETTNARSMILIEPLPEFLLHSMEVVDWAEVFDLADDRGIKLSFLLEDKPSQICRGIETRVIADGRPFLDGTHCHFHYFSWVLREAYTLFSENHRNIALNSGFFEDEVIMMTNAFGNFARHEFFQLESKPHLEQKAPLLVCGAGPSLAGCLPAIKQWREHVVVMSCGTALGALLEAGIRPDLHCENENGELIYDILSQRQREHGLHGITLVASSTLHPSIPPLFERCWLFQRGALTSTTILAPDVKPIHGVDPLVSNAGFSVAATAGFTTIYLLGTDCGAKDPGHHHAAGAYRFEGDDETQRVDEMFRKRFDRELPGNFGGKVHSAWTWDLSRQLFEEAQRQYRVNLFNCSDGARINGAKPRSPRSLRFDAKVDRPRVLSAIERQLRHFKRGEFAKTIDFDAPLDSLAAYRAWIEEKVSAARDGDPSFFRLFTALSSLPAERRQEWRPATSFVTPSIESMVWMGAFFGDRIDSADERQRYFDVFLDRFSERLQALFDSASDFLKDLKSDAEELATA